MKNTSTYHASAAMSNLWAYLQGLSLSLEDRHWLADKLLEKKEKKAKKELVFPHIDEETIINTIQHKGTDFEDTVQYYSALPYQPDVIITRDKKGFSNLDILVMTPAEFIERSRDRSMPSPVTPEF